MVKFENKMTENFRIQTFLLTLILNSEKETGGKTSTDGSLKLHC